MNDPAIRFATLPGTGGRSIGHVVLDNPRSLNATRLDMIEPLLKQLTAWDTDAAIAAILIEASGDRAFCAGGDIRALYDGMTGQGDPDYPQRFFTKEYRLCHTVHRLATPCIGWGHGLVMGGGLGLFAGASHRVVTAESKLAMPEIKIGLFPDCAATWFFNRLPGRLGLFVALTGAVLGPRDALFADLADRAIDHEARSDVIDALTLVSDWNSPHAAVDRVLRRFAEDRPAALDESKLLTHVQTIQHATDSVSLAGIASNIRRLADASDDWLVQAAQALDGGCPVTAHLVHRQLRDGRYLSLKQVVMRELKMALQCCRHPDFAEGVRALLVDKDKQPHWHFDSIAEVPADYVDAHFRAPWDGDHPLRDLPDIKP